MRCPKCGRFSKVIKVYENEKDEVIYSDCKYCGRVLIDDTINERDSGANKTKEYVMGIFIIVFFVVSAGLSGYLYFKINSNRLVIDDLSRRYMDIRNEYLALRNVSDSLETYYEEIQEMYSTLRDEYSQLEESYILSLQEKASLYNEFDALNDIIDLEESIFLEYNRSIHLLPERNITLSYDTIYGGYVIVNYNASSDIVLWIGSSVTENEYYARHPPFPQTALNGTFTVPVCRTVYVYIYNPSEENEAVLTLSINHIY